MTHPITPSPELLQDWGGRFYDQQLTFDELVTEVYKAGADQELEACCECLRKAAWNEAEAWLRIARRPKPPSLKEQALNDLDSMSIEPCWINGIDANAPVRAKYNTIRRALEQLNG